MVESAAACPVRSGVSGERPLGRVKVPEGIDEAWRVARDLPAEPWPLLSVRRFAPSSSGHIMQLVSPPRTWLGY